MAASMCRRLPSYCARNFSRFTHQNVSRSMRCAYSTAEASSEQSAETPKAIYPPIIPPLFGNSEETQEYRAQLAIQSMNDKSTATEMITELSKDQSWHYNVLPWCFHYSFLNLYKHSMKTVMVEDLPPQINDLTNSPAVEQAAERLKPHIIDCILQEQVYAYRHKGDIVCRERVAGQQTMENVMRVILAGLAGDYPHLLDAEIDHNVEVKSFWKRDNTKFQFFGKPLFLVRTKDPLPEFTSKDDELSIGEVTSWPYAPENVSVFKKHVNPVCFPGFKVGNPFNCAHTQIYMTDINRRRCEQNQILDEVLKGSGLATSFGWLYGLAMYNMYNPHRDLKRPMTCQTIVSDGSKFSFFCYQLNTMSLCSRSPDNPLQNICWHTQDLSLYGDILDGRVSNFNMDVLKQIVAFLVNPTVALEE